ncbi:MAG: hypothetical protein ABIQ06_02045 [Caldimonas sp.]
MRSKLVPLLAAVAAATLLVACGTMGSKNDMTFFVASTGGGKGADLGGLTGADQLCTRLATAAGATGHDWRAYLSTVAVGNTPGVNARDRIGAGPWRNAKAVVVAENVAGLHGTNNLNKNTALTEKGEVVNGRGDTPNMHDILTGSQPDGTAIAGAADTTCGNWTRSGEGAAMVGHHDRNGTGAPPQNASWNSSHQSNGCSHDALKATGGDARIYCFARN